MSSAFPFKLACTLLLDLYTVEILILLLLILVLIFSLNKSDEATTVHINPWHLTHKPHFHFSITSEIIVTFSIQVS